MDEDEKKLNLLRVLLVEDNEDDAALILRELKNADGFEVLMDVVSTENEMRQELLNKTFDIVLCDYYLPTFNVSRAINLLNSLGLIIPFILVSGAISEELLDKISKEGIAGARDFQVVSKDKLFRLTPVIKRELLLVDTNDKVLVTLARALEYRDFETREHSDRVVSGAVALARAMNLTQLDISHIRRGAVLHDIGKIGIPDSVLLKKGALTAEERRVIERHPLFAYEMLKDIPFLDAAMDIPYCHHERWDGSGYPRGIKGKDIPLYARIFAVVDNYDALTSDRPYRKALTREFALTYISEHKGKHFDPDVVEAFLKIMSFENKL